MSQFVSSGPPAAGRSPDRRRRLVAFAVTFVVALAGAGIAVDRFAGRQTRAAEVTGSPVVEATTTVTRGTLSTGRSMTASLGYGSPHKITGGLSGVITWLPGSGTTIRRGDQVYRVDDVPVALFYGKIPFYRDLAVEGLVGRDVRVLANNLKALGYAVGWQPRTGSVIAGPAPAGPVTPTTPATAGPEPGAKPGAKAARARITVREGESVLTPALISALKSWQRDAGRPADGHLRLGSVVVRPVAFRVSALSAQVGDPASGEVMSVTSTRKVLGVEADEGDAASIERGDRATVTLPDSRTTTATVTAVGTALQAPQDDQSQPKLTVTLTLDHPSTLKRVDAADLEVSFAVETHRNVLTVPVGALLALQEGGYAVQKPSGGLVGVETGIFSRGIVEIKSDAATEGMKVVTTS